MPDSLLYFNGLNPDGTYVTPPLDPETLVERIVARYQTPPDFGLLKHMVENPKDYAVRFGTDADDLKESGWGLVLPAAWEDERKAAMKKALASLLTLRRDQAGTRYRELEYRPGETKAQFLKRFKAGSGPVNPDKVPFYLLLVGSPQEIPFEFQYQMDVQHAVGRLYFEDPAGYGSYAAGVVAAEEGTVRRPREMAFFSVVNPGDGSTPLSDEQLVVPTRDYLAAKLSDSWKFRTVRGDDADRPALARLLGGSETPALLFTASHGHRLWPEDGARQLADQGALICREWAGGPVTADQLFSARYFRQQQAQPLGMINFHFACFGLGTPRLDQFAEWEFAATPAQIAANDFVAALPQAVLGHPAGGALATVGHVDRAFSYSFRIAGDIPNTVTFESVLESVMSGHRLGNAMEYLNQLYAETATDLTQAVEDKKFGGDVDPYHLVGLWTAHNDARGYAMLGDPAVKLALAANAAAVSVPALVVQPVTDETDVVEPAGSPTEEDRTMSATDPEERDAGAGGHVEFVPPPSGDAVAKLKRLDPQLFADWRDYVRKGYERSDTIFGSTLDAYMGAYRSTVWMYRIMFYVGLGSFLVAAGLSAYTGEVLFGLVFGGLSLVSFLSFFLSRPLQALEENLQFITWLGIIYNTYWTRVASARDEGTVQRDLRSAERAALAELERLVDKHAARSGKRPGLEPRKDDEEA